MKHYTMPDPIRAARMNTAELRSSFLIEGLFTPGRLHLVSTDLDRAIVGGAVPVNTSLSLSAGPEMRAGFFCERRELGVLNIGGHGTVLVDGQSHPMHRLDCLYIGRGSREVIFASTASTDPARFDLVSYPAHAVFPSQLATHQSSAALRLGSQTTVNERSLYKRIYPDGIASCQLVMGYTLLDEGSSWNTMPPHTHQRRSEIYVLRPRCLAAHSARDGRPTGDAASVRRAGGGGPFARMERPHRRRHNALWILLGHGW